MSNRNKPMTPRTAREQGLEGGSRKKRRGKGGLPGEHPDQRLLRQGGWRALVISPQTILFEPLNGRGYFTKEQALQIERSMPEPTGEMLQPVPPGSSIPHDRETGIPWVWGQPPRPSRK